MRLELTIEDRFHVTQGVTKLNYRLRNRTGIKIPVSKILRKISEMNGNRLGATLRGHRSWIRMYARGSGASLQVLDVVKRKGVREVGGRKLSRGQQKTGSNAVDLKCILSARLRKLCCVPIWGSVAL